MENPHITKEDEKLFEAFIYYEEWLHEEALTDKFKIPPHRIITRYDNFLIAKIDENQEKALNSTNIIAKRLPDKNHLSLQTNISKSELTTSCTEDKPITYIVQFIGPIKDEWLTPLKEKNIPTYGYIFPYAIFAYIKSEISTQLKEPYIEWIGRYESKCKIHCECKSNVIVYYFPWSSQSQERCCVDINKEDPDHLQTLAASEDVLYIEPRIIPHLYNAEARQILKADIAHEKGITGLNEIIAITDTGIYRVHETFTDTNKIISFIDIAGDSIVSGGDGDGHGTHVACSVAGDAPPYKQWNKEDGEGFASKLIAVKVFDNRGNWAGGNSEYTFWRQAYDAGARINNNSWGADSGGVYLSIDHDADRIVSDLSDYVLAVAAGNAGPSIRTIGSPAVAKNVISVGACSSNDPNSLAYFSSRGPTLDRRIKPDIIAPGAPIVSARTQTSTSYMALQGTSMASPQIAGVAGLIKQYFREGKYPTIIGSHNASSALVKAMMINGAVEMTGADADAQGEGKFPNSSQGWGRVDVSRTLLFDTSRKVQAWDIPTAPNTGNKWTTNFSVTQDAYQVKITLVWTDAPAVAGATTTLINNLNLRVLTPDGKVFLGNNFVGLNPGYSVPGNTFDNTNNVEGVHLITGLSFGTNVVIPQGQYTVEVISTNMTSINKGFALIVGIDRQTIPPTTVPKIAVIGDYINQLKTIINTEGYVVDWYASGDYALVITNIDKYKCVVFNRVNDEIGFDNLVKTIDSKKIGAVFLGGYPINNYGLGIISKRTGNPGLVDNKWGDGSVKLKVLSTIQPIFKGYANGSIITIISGGDNDYQTYNQLTIGGNFAANMMPRGLPYMVADKGSALGGGRRIYLGSLGPSPYTNVTHWTVQGRRLLLNSIAWTSGFATKTV